MKTKQLNRTDLSELVFVDDDKFELWRRSLSADEATIKKLYTDNLSCASFAIASTSTENIQAVDVLTENISALDGSIGRLRTGQLDILSASDAVSSQLNIDSNSIYLYSGSDISGDDELPEAYGSFVASVTSNDVMLSMSKLTLDGKQQKLSVQTTGFSVLNEQLTVDNKVEESSYVELMFPDDLSGQHTLATRYDISSNMSDYIKKSDDGSLELNGISCQNIFVSAAAEVDTDNIRHVSNITVKTPQSNAQVVSEYKEWEHGLRESDSRFFLRNDGDNGGRDVFYFANGRRVNEEYNPEEQNVSTDIGYSYIMAQTKDVQLAPDEKKLETEKRTRIDFIDDGNPSITASEYSRNSADVVSDRRLKIEIPLADREGDQVMALRSDLEEYSYSKDELDRKFQNMSNLSSVYATIFDFGDGDISAFEWTGLMTSDMLQRAGLKYGSYEWEKQPIFVRIGDCISAVGDYAFAMCSSLQTIDLANIKYIGKTAFGECSGLIDVFIPNMVDIIQDNAFWGCTGLRNVKINNGVEEINQLAFANCTSLLNITLPPSISIIRQNAFEGAGLVDVRVEGRTQPEAVHLLENAALPDGCRIATWNFQPAGDYVQQSSLTGFTTDSGNKNYGISISADGTAYVNVPWETGTPPDTYKSYADTVHQLTSESGFKTYAQTSQQLLNDGYATQTWTAEQGYSAVEVSQDHSSGTQIATITINGTPTALYAPVAGEPVEPNNPTITITQGGVSKGTFTLNQSSNKTISLDAATVPDTYKTYDNTVTALTSQSGFKTYDETAKALSATSGFKTYSQTSAQLSNDGYATQQWVQAQGFGGGGASLSDIQATVFEFEDGDISAFGWTDEITYQKMESAGLMQAESVPPDPTHITWNKQIKSVKIGQKITSIGKLVFYNCDKLSGIVIPDNVTSIGQYAFEGCDALTNVVIGNGVTTINRRAFAGCDNLTSITIPANVTSIPNSGAGSAGLGAFNSCVNLAEIIVEGKTQAEAKTLLAGSEYPSSCTIKTWSFPHIEVVQALPASPDPNKFYFVTT